MDMTRNTRACSKTVFKLSGQPCDDDDPELHTACSQTCRNFLAQVGAAALERRDRLPRREARRLRPRAHLLQRRHGGAQLPRSHADRLHAVAGVRNGRPLPALRGLPQALAGDVGEDALRGDPRPRPRVGAARRGRRYADASLPPRRLKSDGERRPDLHAATILPLSRDGGKGEDCTWPVEASNIRKQTTFQMRGGWRRSRQATSHLESLAKAG